MNNQNEIGCDAYVQSHSHRVTSGFIKGVRALRGYFGPLWSQKLKVAFHQFHLVSLLEEKPKC